MHRDGDHVRLRCNRGRFFWGHNVRVAVEGGNLHDYGPPKPDSVEIESAAPEPPPHTLLPAKLKVGLRWYSISGSRDGNRTSDFSAEVLDREQVTVPAGTFTAWKIEYVRGEHRGTTNDIRAWYTPGVGFVKLVEWQKSVEGSKELLETPIVYQLRRIRPIASGCRWTQLKPVAELPKHVAAPAGKLSLYADYDDVGQAHVALYLVNRTKKAIRFPNLGRWVDSRLEFRNEAGRWQRAQRIHFSTCLGVVDCEKLSLDPETYVCREGWRPATGTIRQIRYKLYEEHEDGQRFTIASNVGYGPVDPEEVKVAATDGKHQPNSAAMSFHALDTISEFFVSQEKRWSVFQTISKAKYPKNLHTVARFQRERWFGEKAVVLRIRPAEPEWRPSRRLPVVVEITNPTAKTISFHYRRPTEILKLYLLKLGSFVQPRPGVARFTDSRSPEITRVTLKPGDTHRVRVDLIDYFDSKFAEDQRLKDFEVFVSCRIPGIHTIPQLDRQGTVVFVAR